MNTEHEPLLSAAASSLTDPDPQHAQMRRRGHRFADAVTAALVWSAASALAILVSDAAVPAAALPAALAPAATVIGLRWPVVRRLAAPAALATAALEPSTVLPWAVAAVCLSFAIEQRAANISLPGLGALEECLERCRRRGDPATVLVLQVPADAVAVRNLLRTVRVTDSFEIRRLGDRFEVYGLLEECDGARTGIETRFAASLHGVTPRFGWASYPVDGLTLDVLLEHARTSIQAAPDTAETLHGELTQPHGPHSDPVIAVTFDTPNEATQS